MADDADQIEADLIGLIRRAGFGREAAGFAEIGEYVDPFEDIVEFMVEHGIGVPSVIASRFDALVEAGFDDALDDGGTLSAQLHQLAS